MTTREPSDLRTGTHAPLHLPRESRRRLHGPTRVHHGTGQASRPGGHASLRHPDGARPGRAVQISADRENHPKATASKGS